MGRRDPHGSALRPVELHGALAEASIDHALIGGLALAAHGAARATADLDLEEYWGPPPSPAFVIARWNWKAVRNVAGLLVARLRAARRER